MVTYMNKKYSLERKYIGKIVFLEVSGDFLKISYDNKLIATHKLSEKKINYRQNDIQHISYILIR